MAGPKSYLDLVKATDSFPRIDISRTPYHQNEEQSFYQLLLPNDPRSHGYMRPSVVQQMPWTPDFQISHEFPRTVQLLDSSNGVDTAGACNRAFASVIGKAADSKIFKSLTRTHHEEYKILGARYPTVRLLRTAAPLFGVVCRGAHMTAYVRTEDGIKIWVARRSAHLFTYPNKLDSSVAGGVRAEESPLECIIHESDEEASLPAEYVRKHARACGAMTYVAQTGGELALMNSVCLYLYDIEVPAEMILTPRDDEVEEFYLWSVNRVMEALRNEEFKTNSAAVMVDFFIRHGIVTEENEEDYLEIVTRLHRTLPVPTSPTAT